MIKFLLTIFLILMTNLSYSGLFVGSGFSSATSGRISPTLNTGLDFSQFALTISSVGVKNDYYYHSAYNLIFAFQADFPPVLWGDLRGGIGLGAHYAKRSIPYTSFTLYTGDIVYTSK